MNSFDTYWEVIFISETLLHVVMLTDTTNYTYKELKSPIPGTSYKSVFTSKSYAFRLIFIKYLA